MDVDDGGGGQIATYVERSQVARDGDEAGDAAAGGEEARAPPRVTGPVRLPVTERGPASQVVVSVPLRSCPMVREAREPWMWRTPGEGAGDVGGARLPCPVVVMEAERSPPAISELIEPAMARVPARARRWRWRRDCRRW